MQWHWLSSMRVGILITSCSCRRHVSFSSSMGAGIVWRKCSCRVAQSWELRNLSKAVAQAELRNPTSCASRVAQSWKLREASFVILVAQSGEVAESDFIPHDGQTHQQGPHPRHPKYQDLTMVDFWIFFVRSFWLDKCLYRDRIKEARAAKDFAAFKSGLLRNLWQNVLQQCLCQLGMLLQSMPSLGCQLCLGALGPQNVAGIISN